MLFIISMLLLETHCHIGKSNWKVKCAQGTFHSSTPTGFQGLHLGKVTWGGRVPFGKIFFWRKKFTTMHVLLMYPCYLPSFEIHLLWSSFPPFLLLLALIASFSCYAIFKLIKAVAPSYYWITFRGSDLSQSQDRTEPVIKGLKWKKNLPNLGSDF